jgi:hypothetical protein
VEGRVLTFPPFFQVIEPPLTEHNHLLSLKVVVARATIEQVSAIEAILAKQPDKAAAAVMLELQKAEWDEATQAPRVVSSLPSLGEVRRIIAQHREQQQSTLLFLLANAGSAGVQATSFVTHGVPALCVVLAFPKAIQLAMESARGMEDIARKVVAFMDGTYGLASSGLQVSAFVYIRRRLTCQVVSVAVLTNQGFASVIAYMITDSRSTEAYQYLLEQLACLGFQPDYFMCDFETAEANAIRLVWPEAVVRGCLFHFLQAAERKWKQFYGGRNASAWPKAVEFLRNLAACRSQLLFEQQLDVFRVWLDNTCFSQFERYFMSQWVAKVGFLVRVPLVFHGILSGSAEPVVVLPGAGRDCDRPSDE